MLPFRVVLDFVGIGLFLLCLAYWWLDNLAHEIIGTVFFGLLIAHNVFNRRWYGSLPKVSQDIGRLFNTIVIVCLAIGMSIMLVSSLVISKDLFRFVSLDGAFTVRSVHMFTAYWTLVFIGIHLGTRWAVVMNVCRGLFGISVHSTVRNWLSKAIAVVVALYGAHAVLDMGLSDKLMLRYSLDMWDFNADAFGFFLRYAAIVAVPAVVTHYAMRYLLFQRKRKAVQT